MTVEGATSVGKGLQKKGSGVSRRVKLRSCSYGGCEGVLVGAAVGLHHMVAGVSIVGPYCMGHSWTGCDLYVVAHENLSVSKICPFDNIRVEAG